MLALPLLSGALLNGCASSPKLPPGLPDPAAPGDDLETVVIAGTNDIHGTLAPIRARTKEASGEGTEYEWGGAAILGAHLRILHEQFGPRLIHLDAGDEFQGSIESNTDEGAPMVTFFNAVGLNAAAVGNHEFDFGPAGPESRADSGSIRTDDPLGALEARIREAKYPYLSANTYTKAGQYPGIPGTLPTWMVPAGSVKIGVIGLTTTSTPVTTRAEFVRGLAFRDFKDITVREAARLRKEGAQAIVIVAHAGLKCDRPAATAGYRVRKPTDPQGACNDRDEVPALLENLPPGTVDAVVSGHTHTVVHHWVQGVPVIQGGSRGQAYNLIYLTIDRKTGRARPDLTRIEGPIPVCAKIFANQGNCDGDAPPPAHGRGKLVTPVFHGQSIHPDARIEQALAPVFEKSDREKSRVVGQAARDLTYGRLAESPMGNLVADAVRARAHADVAIVNAGGIRAPIDAGPITYESVFRTLPFDNSIVVLTVSGAELKRILRVAESGGRGWFPVSGLHLRLVDLKFDAPTHDLNRNGRLEPWETDRLLDAKLDDGRAIDDRKTYRLATIDFLVTGGDDMGWVMAQIPESRRAIVPGGLMRQSLAEYLTAHPGINSERDPLVNPAAPRIRPDKPRAGKRGKGRRRRRSRR